jgi:hypothetical protein
MMVTGASEHLLWELAYLKLAGLHAKLFLLTPRLAQEHARRGEMVSALRRAGYQPFDEDPGPGAVVTFDGEGHTVLACQDAMSPAETIRPMHQRIGH